MIAYRFSVISIVSDFFLSAFPILILRKVQISFRSKVGLCALMGLGVIPGSLSIVRTVLNWQTETNDPTWSVIPNWYWRAWEVFFGIAAAFIPTIRPGYKWLAGILKNRFTKVRGGGPTKPTTGPSAGKKSAMPLKTSKGLWTDSLMATSTVHHEEDICPYRIFT